MLGISGGEGGAAKATDGARKGKGDSAREQGGWGACVGSRGRCTAGRYPNPRETLQAPELLTMRPQRMMTRPEEGSQVFDVLLQTPALLLHSPSAEG